MSEASVDWGRIVVAKPASPVFMISHMEPHGLTWARMGLHYFIDFMSEASVDWGRIVCAKPASPVSMISLRVRQDPPLRLIRPLRLGGKKLQNIITVLLPSNILIQPDTHESLQQQRLDFWVLRLTLIVGFVQCDFWVWFLSLSLIFDSGSLGQTYHVPLHI